MTETKLLWKRSASRLALIGVLGTGLAAPALAQTMESALSRAYSGNPTLNSQRAAVRATNENVPQALSGYRPRINASADIGASITEISATPPISCTAVGSEIEARKALNASSATPRHKISVTVA